ncbi:MAG TPA: hypothetical protein VMD59_02710, partial [Acidimicrobiales bacterium]|nr:hypothetical protein [Acidimicrobiales bacterium]
VELEAARERALALLQRLDRQPFDEASPGLVATVSAGLAAGTPGGMRDLWSDADTALYQAKAGMGQLVVRSRLAVHAGRGGTPVPSPVQLRRDYRHASPLASPLARADAR